SQSRPARNDRTFRGRRLLAFEHACVLGNANPPRCRMHVFRNANVLADNSVLLLPSNVTGWAEGGCLWNCRRDQRLPLSFAEAEFHSDGTFYSRTCDLVDTR